MNTKQTQLLRSVLRSRDVFVGDESKCDVAELAALHIELDDSITRLTNGAAEREAITRQSRV